MKKVLKLSFGQGIMRMASLQQNISTITQQMMVKLWIGILIKSVGI